MIFVKVLCLTGMIIAVYGAGEMTILQTPESITFKGEEELDLSSVKNVLSTALGFTIPETPRWSGMFIKDPFRFAEAVAIVSVPGATSLGESPLQGRIYPLRTDEPLHDTWDAIEWRVSERFPMISNLTAVRIRLDSPAEAEKYLGDIVIRETPSLQYLKPTVAEEKAFLDQIMLMDAVTNKISSMGIKSDGVPDIYWFDVPGLHPLIDTYGEDSKRVVEAKGFLSSSVLLLCDVFSTIYDNKIVFATLSSDVVHTRRYRREANATDSMSQSGDDDSEYAAIFNIILWFSIAFAFALLATSIGIATMDPGRDSIIYRMTSNRMKKEN